MVEEAQGTERSLLYGVTVLGEVYPSMVHSRQDCDKIALEIPLRGSGCMPQTSRGCAMTGSSDSARVYEDVPKNATNEGESAMHMHGHLIQSLATALIGIFCVTVGLGGAAQAQTPTRCSPGGCRHCRRGRAGRKIRRYQRHAAGQVPGRRRVRRPGQSLVRGIGSGWTSYLTPDGKLVPGFNCNPPEEIGQTCEPQGTRWKDGKLYLATRHRGILIYDPKNKEVKTLVYTWRNQLFKGPNDLDFDADGNLFFTDPWATGPGPNMSDQSGAVYQYSRDGVLRKVMDGLNFPNGIAVSPDNNTLAVGDCHGGSDDLRHLRHRADDGQPACPRIRCALTFSRSGQGPIFPGTAARRPALRRQRQSVGGRSPARRHGPDRSARPHRRLRADPEQRPGDDQLRVRRPRQPVHLFHGRDQRHVLALQGALSRADRPRRRPPAGATLGSSAPGRRWLRRPVRPARHHDG